MNIFHEKDYQFRVGHTGVTQFLPDSTVEIVHNVKLDEPPRYALFDFDGTLSLIREGWVDVMVPMMVELLLKTGTTETEEDLSHLVTDFVLELTGKQTIYQMNRLVEEIEKRGGHAEEPRDYKRLYHERLMQRIRNRRDALHKGELNSTDMLVPYALDALQALQDRGVELYLASGTDQQYVCEEAELLGLDAYFGPRIYGALDDYTKFSKQMVIEHILNQHDGCGSRLIGFGDGYVEIDNVKSAGGMAVAVASDESGRSGKPDLWKRDRLIGVGADIVIPDFRDCRTLFAYIWGGLPVE